MRVNRVAKGRLRPRYTIKKTYFGAVAQLGERIVRNDEVGGSNPPSSTRLDEIKNLRFAVQVGSLGDRRISESPGSNPARAQRCERSSGIVWVDLRRPMLLAFLSIACNVPPE